MRVELKTLKPNPMRDFKIDPIDQDMVAKLTESIKDHGFWGGVVCRKTRKNGIQIAAGHHRIEAAIKAKIQEADVFVGDFDDAQMIQLYATENATQRGNMGTALAGSVAAAVRFLVKAMLASDSPEIRRVFESQHAYEQAQKSLLTDNGLGEPPITKFLEEVPGIHKNAVTQQLANIKASGDYARIVREVQEEIEAENKEAIRELKRQEEETARRVAEAEEADRKYKEAQERRKQATREAKAATEEAERKRADREAAEAELARQKAEAMAKLAEKRREEAKREMAKFDALRQTRNTAQKAVDKAESREVTFDFEGVAQYFRSPSHIDVFRQMVTGPGVKPYLPVNGQAGLAKKLTKMAGEGELSARFIRENLMALLTDAKTSERRLNTEEQAQLVRKTWESKARVYMENFARNARGLLAAAIDLAEHDAKRPKGVTLHATSEFNTAVQNVERAVVRIRKVIP